MKRAPTADAVLFRTIHDKYFSLVQRALVRLGVREHDLPDLAQQVFLVAFLRLPQFEGRSTLSTWLWGICRRVASEYRRSAYVRREVAVGVDDLEASAPHAEDPAVDLERQQRLAAIGGALDVLPETQRVALVLFEVEEMPARLIAESLRGATWSDHPDRFRRQRLRPAVAKERRLQRQPHRLCDDREQRRVRKIPNARVLPTGRGHRAGKIDGLTQLESERATAGKHVGNAVSLVRPAVAELRTVHDDGAVEQRSARRIRRGRAAATHPDDR